MQKWVANLPIFPKLARGSGQLFNAMMMCGMICPSDEVTLDGVCSIACHPIKTLTGGGNDPPLEEKPMAEKNDPLPSGKGNNP